METHEPSVRRWYCCTPSSHPLQALVTYLLQLARHTNAAHASLRVMGAPTDRARARLQMFKAARMTLGEGLRLLGLTPLTRI